MRKAIKRGIALWLAVLLTGLALLYINTPQVSAAERRNMIDVSSWQGDIDWDHVAASYAPLQEQIDALADRLDALTARVSTLKQSGETGGEEPGEPEEEWPEYIQPTGSHDAYHNGDKVTWNGQHYTCIAPEGTACVWDPDTYPAYWQLVEDTQEDAQ